MDTTVLDDVITRLHALRLTAQLTGNGAIYGSLFTDELPRLEKLRADLESRREHQSS